MISGPIGSDAERASGYLDARGREVLGALDEVAASHGVSVGAVAIAWLLAKPRVDAPIASARTVEQLSEILPAVGLVLTADELVLLDEVSG